MQPIEGVSDGFHEIRDVRCEVVTKCLIDAIIMFVALWMTEYGEREGMKRFLRDYDGVDLAKPPKPPKEPKEPS